MGQGAEPGMTGMRAERESEARRASVSTAPGVARRTAADWRRATARALAGGGAALVAWLQRPGALSDALRRARPQLAPLALAPVVSALALLLAQGVAPAWSGGLAALGVALFAQAGASALNEAPFGLGLRRSRRDDARVALGLGIALLLIAALCGLPLALAGGAPVVVVGALGLVAIALATVEAARRVVAPAGEALAALALGPGVVSLTILGQGRPMNPAAWLVAAAYACFALAALTGRGLRRLTGDEERGGRTLVGLLGARGATALLAVSVVAAYLLALALAAPTTSLALYAAPLALASLPVAALGVTGLWVSHYVPARRRAAGALVAAYTWFGVAFTTGLLVMAAVGSVSALIVGAFGG